MILDSVLDKINKAVDATSAPDVESKVDKIREGCATLLENCVRITKTTLLGRSKE